MSDFQTGCAIGILATIYFAGIFGVCRTVKRQIKPPNRPPAPARFIFGAFWPLIVIGVGIAEVLFDVRTAEQETSE